MMKMGKRKMYEQGNKKRYEVDGGIMGYGMLDDLMSYLKKKGNRDTLGQLSGKSMGGWHGALMKAIDTFSGSKKTSVEEILDRMDKEGTLESDDYIEKFREYVEAGEKANGIPVDLKAPVGEVRKHLLTYAEEYEKFKEGKRQTLVPRHEAIRNLTGESEVKRSVMPVTKSTATYVPRAYTKDLMKGEIPYISEAKRRFGKSKILTKPRKIGEPILPTMDVESNEPVFKSSFGIDFPESTDIRTTSEQPFNNTETVGPMDVYENSGITRNDIATRLNPASKFEQMPIDALRGFTKGPVSQGAQELVSARKTYASTCMDIKPTPINPTDVSKVIETMEDIVKTEVVSQPLFSLPTSGNKYWNEFVHDERMASWINVSYTGITKDISRWISCHTGISWMIGEDTIGKILGYVTGLIDKIQNYFIGVTLRFKASEQIGGIIQTVGMFIFGKGNIAREISYNTNQWFNKTRINMVARVVAFLINPFYYTSFGIALLLPKILEKVMSMIPAGMVVNRNAARAAIFIILSGVLVRNTESINYGVHSGYNAILDQIYKVVPASGVLIFVTLTYVNMFYKAIKTASLSSIWGEAMGFFSADLAATHNEIEKEIDRYISLYSVNKASISSEEFNKICAFMSGNRKLLGEKYGEVLKAMIQKEKETMDKPEIVSVVKPPVKPTGPVFEDLETPDDLTKVNEDAPVSIPYEDTTGSSTTTTGQSQAQTDSTDSPMPPLPSMLKPTEVPILPVMPVDTSTIIQPPAVIPPIVPVVSKEKPTTKMKKKVVEPEVAKKPVSKTKKKVVTKVAKEAAIKAGKAAVTRSKLKGIQGGKGIDFDPYPVRSFKGEYANNFVNTGRGHFKHQVYLI